MSQKASWRRRCLSRLRGLRAKQEGTHSAERSVSRVPAAKPNMVERGENVELRVSGVVAGGWAWSAEQPSDSKIPKCPPGGWADHRAGRRRQGWLGARQGTQQRVKGRIAATVSKPPWNLSWC